MTIRFTWRKVASRSKATRRRSITLNGLVTLTMSQLFGSVSTAATCGGTQAVRIDRPVRTLIVGVSEQNRLNKTKVIRKPDKAPSCDYHVGKWGKLRQSLSHHNPSTSANDIDSVSVTRTISVRFINSYSLPNHVFVNGSWIPNGV